LNDTGYSSSALRRNSPRENRRSPPGGSRPVASARSHRRWRAPFALTGTPGTGKSSVAARLGPRHPSEEVGKAARAVGAATGRGRSTVVDLARLAVAWKGGRSAPPTLLVGHLSHLAPIQNAIVLRCHPETLARRLRRADRGRPSERAANYVSEALDVVLIEALAHHRTVWEIDTTGRSPADVAREVVRILDGRAAPHHGGVDWLSDPRVTAHLLRGGP
jgi:adenylate kinase